MTAICGVKLNCFIHTCMVIYKPICRYQLPWILNALYGHLGKPQKKKTHSKRKKVNMRKHFAWNPRIFLGTHDFLFGTHDFFLGNHTFLPTTFYPRQKPTTKTHHPRHFTHGPRLFTHAILPTTVS